MKKISEHLGEIIVSLACIAFLISVTATYKAPISDFFAGITTKTGSESVKVLDAFDFDSDGGEEDSTITDGEEDGTITDGEEDGTATDGEENGGTTGDDEEGDGEAEVVYAPVTAFYTYTGTNTSGYRLGLTDAFREALNARSDYVVDGDLLWKYGTPLPNPGYPNTSKTFSSTNHMFEGVSASSLDLSKWNVATVTNMEFMFYNCSGLKTLDLSGWNTAKLTNMTAMFSGCSSLKTLDLSGWDTSSVVSCDDTFYGCGLETLNLSEWDTSNVTTASDMFRNCRALKSVDLSTWQLPNLEDMTAMFKDCSKLTSLDLASLDLSRLENPNVVFNMNLLFDGCSSLTSIVAKTETEKALLNIELARASLGGCTVTVK